jgi:prefoldin subunit 5
MSVERELGEMSSRLRTLEREMSETRETLKELHELALQAKGGWKTLMLVAGFAGLVGAIGAKVAMVIGLLPR